MGIKENFSQAVRELTGAGKEEKRNDNKATVDGMRNAVAADDTSEFMAVSEPTPEPAPMVDEFEEIERRAAMAAENLNRQQNAFTQGEYNPNQAAQAQPAAAPAVCSGAASVHSTAAAACTAASAVRSAAILTAAVRSAVRSGTFYTDSSPLFYTECRWSDSSPRNPSPCCTSGAEFLLNRALSFAGKRQRNNCHFEKYSYRR